MSRETSTPITARSGLAMARVIAAGREIAMRDSRDVEEFIRGTIERLLATARAEDTLPAAGDLDMAVMYLRHYLRRLRECLGDAVKHRCGEGAE